VENQENEVKENTTYAERINKAQEEARGKIFERKKAEHAKPKVMITDQEREWARQTFSLVDNDSFKIFKQMCHHIVADRMAKIHDSPPENWLPKDTSWGERCAFNKGLFIGLRLQLLNLENIWKMELEAQNNEKKQ